MKNIWTPFCHGLLKSVIRKFDKPRGESVAIFERANIVNVREFIRKESKSFEKYRGTVSFPPVEIELPSVNKPFRGGEFC